MKGKKKIVSIFDVKPSEAISVKPDKVGGMTNFERIIFWEKFKKGIRALQHRRITSGKDLTKAERQLIKADRRIAKRILTSYKKWGWLV